MRNILESLKERVESGQITMREAAIELYNAGWINYIDARAAEELISRCNNAKQIVKDIIEKHKQTID